MQKAEPRQQNVQSQPAARQTGGMAFASPQGEQIAQLEAMIESSPQAEKLGGLAAMMNTSPAMAAQRKLAGMIHSSPRQAAQRKFFESMHNRPAQVVQRIEDEEPLQGKFTSDAPAQLEPQPAPKPNNTGLPDNLKSGIENLSGMSMDNVKVHYNSSQPAQLNALAYAQGTDIHVAPGQEQHLPHEAWHVVQQAQGRVQPTMQMKEGVPINDDQRLEHEADIMGTRALASQHDTAAAESATVRPIAFSEITNTSNVVMRQVDYVKLKTYLEGTAGFVTGKSITMDLANVNTDIRDTIEDLVQSANLQSTSTIFHGNEHGLLPNSPGGIDRDYSPFIEFNVAKKSGADRIIYDVRTQSAYLSRHYSDFIELAGLALVPIQYLEGIAFTNVGYVIVAEAPNMVAAAQTANDLFGIQTLIKNGQPVN